MIARILLLIATPHSTKLEADIHNAMLERLHREIVEYMESP